MLRGAFVVYRRRVLGLDAQHIVAMLRPAVALADFSHGERHERRVGLIRRLKINQSDEGSS